MKNVSCSRLGNTLYQDIKKGKEAMKTSNFQRDIEGAAAYMNIKMIAANG